MTASVIPVSFTVIDDFTITEDPYDLPFFSNNLLGFTIKDGLEIDIDKHFLHHPDPDVFLPDELESHVSPAQARSHILPFMTEIGRSNEQISLTWQWCYCTVGLDNWAGPVDRISVEDINFSPLLTDLTPYCCIIPDADILNDLVKQTYMLHVFEYFKTRCKSVEIVSSVTLD